MASKRNSWFSLFWLFHTSLSFLISLLFLTTPGSAPEGLFAHFFTVIYFWGHFGLLVGILSLPFLILLLIKKIRPAVQIGFLFFMSLFQTVLCIDTFVYQQYRFHINLFVLELLFKGKGQIISFPWILWFSVFGGLAFLFFVQLVLHFKILKSDGFKKITKAHFFFWLFSLLVSHLIHMVGFAQHNYEITKIGFLPPFAAPLKDDKLVARLGFEVIPQSKMSLQGVNKNSLLNYPLQPMKCTSQALKQNILVIVLDSTRFDQLSSEVMPHTFELSQKSQVYLQHFSGSNSTRGGIFSLMYGLPPLYFEKFREVRKGPVLLDQMIKEEYQLGIFSSAPLTMPEFNQTVFQAVSDLRTESKATDVLLRDQEITDLWLQFIQNRNPEKPFFGFLFYDTPHEFAEHPDFKKFKPSLEVINYFKLNNSTDPIPFLNRHKNSVYYVDQLLGRVYQQMQNLDLFKNTVVIFTSDHGQEFNDNKLNFWGHNSNFTNAQTQVPFFIYWPNQKPTQVNKWTTSYDVPATLLQEVLGCENPSSDYSSGDNLLKHPGHQWMIHGTYGDFAIRLKDHFVKVELSGNYELLDLNYNRIQNIENDPELYQKALLEMRRFYK